MSEESSKHADAEHPPDSAPAANPAALTVAQLARLLGLAEEKVHEHVGAGAPASVDGSINLVRYVAWLNQRLKDRDPRNDGTEV